jgi:hypothetical protein
MDADDFGLGNKNGALSTRLLFGIEIAVLIVKLFSIEKYQNGKEFTH